MVKVVIDQIACIACGLCYTTCEEVFEGDDEGTARLVDEYRGKQVYEGDVPDDIDCTEEAEEGCPVDAIESG